MRRNLEDWKYSDRVKLTQFSPWGRRMYDLSGAMGWSIAELGLALGFGGGDPTVPVYRILRGGIPKAATILNLEKLESVYAAEIARFIKGHRPYKKRRKVHLNALKREAAKAGLSTLGVLDPVVKNERPKPKRVRKRRVRFLVLKPTRRGVLFGMHKEKEPGRPPAESGEPQGTAQ